MNLHDDPDWIVDTMIEAFYHGNYQDVEVENALMFHAKVSPMRC